FPAESGHFQIGADGDPAILPAPGPGNGADRLDDISRRFVRRNDLKFHLVNDIRDELGATEAHCLPLLLAMAGYGAFHEIVDAHFLEGVPYLLQLELLDDRFYQLHGTPPRAG